MRRLLLLPALTAALLTACTGTEEVTYAVQLNVLTDTDASGRATGLRALNTDGGAVNTVTVAGGVHSALTNGSKIAAQASYVPVTAGKAAAAGAATGSATTAGVAAAGAGALTGVGGGLARLVGVLGQGVDQRGAVVGAGALMTCVGFGTMLSLAVFLQPISDAMGWSRAGISAAATLDFLCMGFAAFAGARCRIASAPASWCWPAACCSGLAW